ncbi:hypothetical protein QBC36DRAFT_97466 [Triangularia setosa]|uniref:Uncharacterized protein n=1 Tax=Triangularia setosa TaxID=2587417 RepID=A0AAN6WJQ7_9PEZI|nr:hypothetical protein QBC36DRAFT_97466 [Podospora setosa]
MSFQPPATPRKQIVIGGHMAKAKGSHPNSSCSRTSTGRQLRYGHCPTCKLGILERRRNNPEGKGPDAGLWRLSCTRYSAVPPCRHYEAFQEDPAIIWQRKQNELGKGLCPECHFGRLVERIKNPFDFTEKYTECSRRGEEGGGCNYRRLITKGKTEADKKDMEMPNVNNVDQDDISNMNQDAGESKPVTKANHTHTEEVVKPDNETANAVTPEPATFTEQTTEGPSVSKTSGTLNTSTTTVSPKDKVKITIDLTLDDDEDDAKYGSVSACYPASSAVYPAQTRLFQSPASPRNPQGMLPPKKMMPQPSTLQKSASTTPKGHSSILITPRKSPMLGGQSPFSGKLMPAAKIPGLVNTPTKPPGTVGQHYSAYATTTPVSNRSNKTFSVPVTVPHKRTREDEFVKFDEFDDLDSDVKNAMVELADKFDKPSTSNNLNNRNQARGQVNNTPSNRFSNQTRYQGNNSFNSYTTTPVYRQFNRPPNHQFNNPVQGYSQFSHPPNPQSHNQMNNPVSNSRNNVPNSSPWDTYQANRLTNSQFLKTDVNNQSNHPISNHASTNVPKPTSTKCQKQDEFDEFDDSDDQELMALAEKTEKKFFSSKKY